MSGELDFYRGSCLCGAVSYEFTGQFERFFLCHCSRCRKGSGSAHASNMFFSGVSFRWLSGEDLVGKFTVDGARHTRTFCTRCGSGLPQLQPEGRLKVPAGSIDSPVKERPQAHIWTSSRADWDDHLEDVPSVAERPA